GDEREEQEEQPGQRHGPSADAQRAELERPETTPPVPPVPEEQDEREDGEQRQARAGEVENGHLRLLIGCSDRRTMARPVPARKGRGDGSRARPRLGLAAEARRPRCAGVPPRRSGPPRAERHATCVRRAWRPRATIARCSGRTHARLPQRWTTT